MNRLDETARRVVWPAQGVVELQPFSPGEPGPDEVLIRTEHSVVSPGTERAFLTGAPNTSQKFPQYPGYSAVGTILAVGDKVEGRAVGERVLCYHSGHASHAVIPQERTFPTTGYAIESVEASFLIIASMSLQAVRKASVELGEAVMVMGGGILGLFAVQLARCAGAAPVIMVDPDPARREFALSFGADHAFDPDDVGSRLPSAVHEGGPQIVIEASGQPAALTEAIRSAGPRGRVALLGCTRDRNVDVDFYLDVHKTGISLIGAHNFVRPSLESSPGFWTRADDYRALLDLHALGRLPLADLVGRVARPDEAPEVYAELAARSSSSPRATVFDWR